VKYCLAILVLSVGLLAGCPEEPQVSEAPSGARAPLPSCVVLAHQEPYDLNLPPSKLKWRRGVRKGDSYILCGPPFYEGDIPSGCELPEEPVWSLSRYGHEMYVVDTSRCLDVPHCNSRNCQRIGDKIEYPPGCTTKISARKTGTCKGMWGIP
jgi:hypothetical protein